MMDLIQQYYGAERNTALVAIAAGAVMLLLSLFLWRTAPAASLARGMISVFLIAGLFHFGAGTRYAQVVNNRAQEAAKLYSTHTERDIKHQEADRMARVVDSSFNRGLAIYAALVLGGLALLFLSIDLSARKGMALALMVVGVLGLCIESFSMQSNRHYLHAVEAQPVS